MRYKDIEIVLLSTAALFTFVTGFIIYFVFLYRNKQLKNRQEQEQQQSVFQRELLKAQIEVQEQTLNGVSREIHDNITQVLSFVKLNLAMVEKAEERQRGEMISESRERLSQVITDLRDLSKSLSFEHITRMGLVKTIEAEASRLNKSGILNTVVHTKGVTISLGEERELVLFRIFQEALNNTLKHAGAKEFNIYLQYVSNLFTLTIEDDGKGFSPEIVDTGGGSGLTNIENRATLIGAHAEISSGPGKGCKIKISLNPLQRTIFPDGSTNSFG